jgi:cbb3-type cytochrome oxidase cytochrome c subunit
MPPEPTPLELPGEPDPIPAGSLGGLVLGALVLFVIMFVAVVVAPSSAGNAEALDAVQTIELSDAAIRGRDVYLAEGCALCHTQQVRPIVTDADLGIVTLSESPLIPGYQRRGPDLAHAGSRESTGSAGWLAGYLDDPEAFRPDSQHASYNYLSSQDLENLVAYLGESK